MSDGRNEPVWLDSRIAYAVHDRQLAEHGGGVGLRDAGAHIAYASDWPVTDVSVMRSLQAAVTREPYAEDCSDERLSLIDSLEAYTSSGAWAAHREHITGSLKPGLAADLVMINGDIEAVPSDMLGQTGIALTVCGGRITHEMAA